MNFFKEEIESNNPFDGRVQLNPIPDAIKNLIKQESGIIRRLHEEQHRLKVNERMWTFPYFEHDAPINPDANLIEITEALPDPQDYCIGIYFVPESTSDRARSSNASPSKDRDTEMLFKLEARIDQELNKSPRSECS